MIENVVNLLYKENLITLEQLKSILNDRNILDMDLEELVLRLGVNKETVFMIVEDKLNVKCADLDNTIINIDAVRVITRETAVKYCLIPFELKQDAISVAMRDPFNLSVINELKFLSKKQVKPHLAQSTQIKATIEFYYDRQAAENALEDLKSEYRISLNDKDINRQVLDDIQGAPAVRLTNSIIDQAITGNASDIHIEPFSDKVCVRFRIDGALRNIMEIPINIYPSICTRIKIMSKLNIAEKRMPQDGKIEFIQNKYNYDFRVSTLPTVFGEKIVIRILYKTEQIITLSSLGFNRKKNKCLDKMLLHSNGLILVTGPTGSGKSTTMYSLISELNKINVNIVTIEDPIEFTIQGINQVNVNNKCGITFASGLRNILRQDPDIIMVGEIRDEETAQIAVRSAITGHLVISTLHTNDAPSSIPRLIDMGVPSYLVSDAVIAVIAQRLVRKNCEYCKIEYSPSIEEKENFNQVKIQHLYRGTGCPKCDYSGYKGRTVVYEVMYIDSKHREIIANKGTVEELRKYSILNGMEPLRSNCIQLVVDGITTYDELVRTTYRNC